MSDNATETVESTTVATTPRVSRPITAKPESAEWYAEHFVRSKFFKDAVGISQALVKMAMGKELGIGPTMAMAGIYMVDGKPALSANLMAFLIKKSSRYRYFITQHNEKSCTISVMEKVETSPNAWVWETHSPITVTREEFKHLNTIPWQKYPKNMLFARCISQVAKFLCADVFGGAPVYLPDEIPNSGLEVDGSTLEVIDVVAEPVKKAPSSDISFFKSRLSKNKLDTSWVSNILKKEIGSLDDLSVDDLGYVSQALNVRES